MKLERLGTTGLDEALGRQTAWVQMPDLLLTTRTTVGTLLKLFVHKSPSPLSCNNKGISQGREKN